MTNTLHAWRGRVVAGIAVAGVLTGTAALVTAPGATSATAPALDAPPGALSIRVPDRPAGVLARRAAVRTSKAGQLTIPSLGVRKVAILAVGDSDNVMQVPTSPWLLGWWTGSVPFNSPVGSSILAGHVSDNHDRPGALHRLAGVRKGARIEWTRGRTTRVFKVVRKQFTPRTGNLPEKIWRWDGPRVVSLVSCARKVVHADGTFHYTHNVTVTARLVTVKKARN